MNKKRLIVGSVLAVVFSPVMLAGFVYTFISAYFVAGKNLAEVVAQKVDEVLE